MGFIGYRTQRDRNSEPGICIYLECQERSDGAVTCGYAVDVIFPADSAPCRLRGVDSVLALKKFYKLVFSLEERAREHGNDWRAVMQSPEKLLEHLRYTRNARDFTGQAEPRIVAVPETDPEPECLPVSKGS